MTNDPIPTPASASAVPCDPQLSRIVAAASTNATNLKATAGTVEEIVLFNTTASAIYVKFYDKATAPVVGTDTPAFTLQVPANGSVAIPLGAAIPFASGISYAITSAAADTDTTPVTADSITGYVLLSPSAYLMLDTFQGSGGLTGRLPDIGPAWVQGGANTSVVVADGAMTQTILTDPPSESLSTITVSAPVGEIRAIFRITTVQCQYSFSGTPFDGGFIAIGIWPPGSLYTIGGPAPLTASCQTTTGGDLEADVQTLVSEINNNAELKAAGISASRSGTTVTITTTLGWIPFTEGAVPNNSTLAVISGDQTPPAFGNYDSVRDNGDPKNGMLHCIVSSSGLVSPSFFNSLMGGIVPFASMTSRLGACLIPGNSYIFKWCIQPPYCWVGIWASDGTLCAGAVGHDSTMAMYNGTSTFWENGSDANNLYYMQASLLPVPSVPMAAIQNFVNG